MNFRRVGISYAEDDDIHPCGAYKAYVEDYAQELARIWSFAVGDHPSSLAEQLGGRIHYEGMNDFLSEDGSIFVHGESDFDILLPEYTSPRRDRFTVAHELGHYFLHSNQGAVPIVAFRQGSSRIEWEANWFAAALLMPAEPFRDAARQGISEAEIAERFGVSVDAAKVRRKALGD